MSSEVLISTPIDKEGKRYKTYLGLFYSEDSRSLADENLFNALIIKKYKNGATWKMQVEHFTRKQKSGNTTVKKSTVHEE